MWFPSLKINSLLSISSCSIQALRFLWASRIFYLRSKFLKLLLKFFIFLWIFSSTRTELHLRKKNVQQFQRNGAGTHQPDTHPFCHNLTRECQPGWKLLSKKSTNELFITSFCWATSPEERFSWFVNDEVIWKYRHCFVWIKIWLLEKGGYSLTQKNNIIFYLRNIVDIIV